MFRPSPQILAVCAALLGICLTSAPAQAAFRAYEFNKDQNGNLVDPAAASLTLYDGADAVAQGGSAGSVVMALTVNTDAFNADLFAVYFNVAAGFGSFNSDTFTFSMISPETLQLFSKVDANNVNQVVSNASNINPLGGFDIGVQFGKKPGASGGNLLTSVFEITAADTLSLDDFVTAAALKQGSNDVYFGLRAQNTSGGGLGSSWKLYNNGTPVNPVPAPGGLVLLATAVPVAFAYRRLRRKIAEAV